MKLVKIVKTYLQYIKSLLKRGDRFLVVEILKHCVRASLVKTNFEERRLHLLKSVSKPVFLGDDLNKIIETTKRILASFGKISKYKIVLNLDSNFAVTLHSSITVIREKSKIPIDESDLDNLVSQAIWKFYDRQRGKVADKMRINDLDVLLSDVHIKGIKLDGHKVVNPIGFSAKSAELQLSATFTSRYCINGLKSLLPKEQIVFVGEDGPTLAYVLSQIHEETPFLAVSIFPDITSLVAVRDNTVSHLDTFSWGETSLKKFLSDILSVNQNIAGEILNQYSFGKTSQVFARRLEKHLLPELQTFANGIESFFKRINAKIAYIHSFFPLPPVILNTAFKNKFSQSVKILPVYDGLIGEKMGIELKLNKGYEISNAFAAVSGIIVSNFYPQSEQIKKIAKRRIRWLV